MLGRGISQVPNRVQFFIGLGNPNQYWTPVEEYTVIPTVVTEEEWGSLTDDAQVGRSNSVYRDMGKEVTVVTVSGQAIDKYCLVQFVDGSGSEGVPEHPNEYTFYVKVWTARGDGSVTVVRTG